MEGEQPIPEQTVVSEQQEAVTEIQQAPAEEKPVSDGDKKLENTPENQEQSKYKYYYN